MPRRILCVMECPEAEEDEAMRELGRHGYELDFALDREAAIRMNQNADYDAILVDQQVGEEQGVDLVQELERGKRAPCSVLLCCHKPTIDDVHAALAAGMDHVVARPLQPTEVESLVNRDVPESARTYEQRFPEASCGFQTEAGMTNGEQRSPCEVCSRPTSWYQKERLLYFCSRDCLTRYQDY
jgi:DNA-binding response OmpR family regulator